MFRVMQKGASSLARLAGRLLQQMPLNPAQLIRQEQRRRSKKAANVPPKKTYNTPHLPKDPPENYDPENIAHIAFEAPEVPCAVFRPFSKCDEQLGPWASKDAIYKNPEYYSYHRYSFVDIHRHVVQLRAEGVDREGLRCLHEESDEEFDEETDYEDEYSTCDEAEPTPATPPADGSQEPPKCTEAKPAPDRTGPTGPEPDKPK